MAALFLIPLLTQSFVSAWALQATGSLATQRHNPSPTYYAVDYSGGLTIPPQGAEELKQPAVMNPVFAVAHNGSSTAQLAEEDKAEQTWGRRRRSGSNTAHASSSGKSTASLVNGQITEKSVNSATASSSGSGATSHASSKSKDAQVDAHSENGVSWKCTLPEDCQKCVACLENARNDKCSFQFLEENILEQTSRRRRRRRRRRKRGRSSGSGSGSNSGGAQASLSTGCCYPTQAAQWLSSSDNGNCRSCTCDLGGQPCWKKVMCTAPEAKVCRAWKNNNCPSSLMDNATYPHMAASNGLQSGDMSEMSAHKMLKRVHDNRESELSGLDSALTGKCSNR